MKSKDIVKAKRLAENITKLIERRAVLETSIVCRTVEFETMGGGCLELKNVCSTRHEPNNIITRRTGDVVRLLVLEDMKNAIVAATAQLKELGVDYDETN